MARHIPYPELPSRVPRTRVPGWKYALGTAAAVLLGAVFLVATWAKAIQPGAFVDQIRLEGLDTLLPAAVVAWTALALEAALGTALLLALRRLWVLVPAAALTVFFVALTAHAWYLTAHGLREDTAGCGCFGNLVERTPAQAFWQDLLLLGLPLLLSFVGRPRGARRFPPLRTALVALAAVAAVGLAWKAPDLPLDDWATRLSPGTELSRICAGQEPERVCLDTVVPEIAVGEHLVVIADLGDEQLTGAVRKLNAYATAARNGGAPELAVVSSSPADEQRAFFWKWGPAFPTYEVPEPMLRPLYRELPRSFRVKDGTVAETWPGLPPAVEALAGGDELAGDPLGRERSTDGDATESEN